MGAWPGLRLRHEGRPVLVGYSGGLDSSVLLRALAREPSIRDAGLRAVHVHHGLHPDADAWARHCCETCASLGIELTVEHVHVEAAGLGPEGAARAARHAAFARVLGADEVLALAHHRDDQAETFLLRALRGSGVDGLAAMRPWRRHLHGWMWRPLLDVPRSALRACALANEFGWIEDPANADASLDRNFLRAQVLPLLRARWPHADHAFARSSGLCAEAADLLARSDAGMLAAVIADDGSLPLAALRDLPGPVRARLLRAWTLGRGLPPLPATGVAAIEHTLLAAGLDREACFDWAGARIQHWRGALHARRVPVPLPADWSAHWDGRSPLALPGGGQLALEGAEGFEAPLRAQARQGGERIRMPGRRHHHLLKQVLQERGIPPWQRAAMPVLTDEEGQVHAAGDAILSARLDAWLRERSARLQWRPAAIA